jgi:ElaB/YqjD/DUF883 family membrane-anchored ribosome-binding protein
MTSKIHEPMSETEDGISKRLHDAGERVIEFKDSTVRALDGRLDALGAMMKKHPLLAIGIGLGAGYLLGRLVRRR